MTSKYISTEMSVEENKALHSKLYLNIVGHGPCIISRTTRIPGRETLESGEKLMEAITLINDISRLRRPFDLFFFKRRENYL